VWAGSGAASASTACSFILLVTAAEGYTNASGTAVCQPTLTYGGGVCDPDAWAMKVFEEMQAARAGGRSVYQPLMTSIASGCVGMACTFAWGPSAAPTAAAPGTSVSSVETLTSQAALGPTAAGAALGGMGDLAASAGFVWTPGMYQAAKEQTLYLKTSTDAAANHGTSTTASRAAAYGAAGSTYEEAIYVGKASAQGTVALLLIADAQASSAASGAQPAFRAACVQTAGVAQAGLACALRADGDNVCTAVVGVGYATAAAYATCVTPAAAAVAPTPTGALALAAAGLVSVTAALF